MVVSKGFVGRDRQPRINIINHVSTQIHLPTSQMPPPIAPALGTLGTLACSTFVGMAVAKNDLQLSYTVLGV